MPSTHNNKYRLGDLIILLIAVVGVLSIGECYAAGAGGGSSINALVGTINTEVTKISNLLSGTPPGITVASLNVTGNGIFGGDLIITGSHTLTTSGALTANGGFSVSGSFGVGENYMKAAKVSSADMPIFNIAASGSLFIKAHVLNAATPHLSYSEDFFVLNGTITVLHIITLLNIPSSMTPPSSLTSFQLDKNGGSPSDGYRVDIEVRGNVTSVS